MPDRFDGVYFIKAPPNVELEDGLFHITFEIGERTRFRFVISPHNFLKMRRASGKVEERFHKGERNVVGFTDPSMADSGRH